jgi:hypothetical protein
MSQCNSTDHYSGLLTDGVVCASDRTGAAGAGQCRVSISDVRIT